MSVALLQNALWYVRGTDKDVSAALIGQRNGTFYLRDEVQGNYVLSYIFEGAVHHWIVLCNSYGVGLKRSAFCFHDIQNFIAFYCKPWDASHRSDIDCPLIPPTGLGKTGRSTRQRGPDWFFDRTSRSRAANSISTSSSYSQPIVYGAEISARQKRHPRSSSSRSRSGSSYSSHTSTCSSSTCTGSHSSRRSHSSHSHSSCSTCAWPHEHQHGPSQRRTRHPPLQYVTPLQPYSESPEFEDDDVDLDEHEREYLYEGRQGPGGPRAVHHYPQEHSFSDNTPRREFARIERTYTVEIDENDDPYNSPNIYNENIRHETIEYTQDAVSGVAGRAQSVTHLPQAEFPRVESEMETQTSPRRRDTSTSPMRYTEPQPDYDFASSTGPDEHTYDIATNTYQEEETFSDQEPVYDYANNITQQEPVYEQAVDDRSAPDYVTHQTAVYDFASQLDVTDPTYDNLHQSQLEESVLPQEWTAEQVGEFLVANDLARYADNARVKNFNGARLMNVRTVQDLAPLEMTRTDAFQLRSLVSRLRFETDTSLHSSLDSSSSLLEPTPASSDVVGEPGSDVAQTSPAIALPPGASAPVFRIPSIIPEEEEEAYEEEEDEAEEEAQPQLTGLQGEEYNPEPLAQYAEQRISASRQSQPQPPATGLAPVTVRETSYSTPARGEDDGDEAQEPYAVDMDLSLGEYSFAKIPYEHFQEALVFAGLQEDHVERTAYDAAPCIDIVQLDNMGVHDVVQQKKVLHFIKSRKEKGIEYARRLNQGKFKQLPPTPQEEQERVSLRPVQARTTLSNVSPQSSFPVRRWEPEHVHQWLTSIDAADAIPYFGDEVNGGTLLRMTRDDLRDMGIQDEDLQEYLFGHIRNIQIENMSTSRRPVSQISNPDDEPTHELDKVFGARRRRTGDIVKQFAEFDPAVAAQPMLDEEAMQASRAGSSLRGGSRGSRSASSGALLANTPVEQWSRREVGRWLFENNFGRYRQNFDDANVDGKALLTMTSPEQLKSVGVDAVDFPAFQRALAALIQKDEQSELAQRLQPMRKRSNLTENVSEQLSGLRAEVQQPATGWNAVKRKMEFKHLAHYQSPQAPQTPSARPSPRTPMSDVVMSVTERRRRMNAFSWWQIESSPAEALRPLDEAGNGAFVVHRHPTESGCFVLVYKYQGALHTENIRYTQPTGVMRGGFYLEKAQQQVFNSLQDLVGFYEEQAGALHCCLIVFQRPDPQLQPDIAPTPQRASPRKSKRRLMWLMIGSSLDDVRATLLTQGAGSFAITTRGTEDSLVLVYKSGTQLYEEDILTHANDGSRWTGFHLRSNPQKAFPSLHDLVVHYETQQPETKCGLKVMQQELTSFAADTVKMDESWGWCQIGVPDQVALEALSPLQNGRFIVTWSNTSRLGLTLQVVQNGQISAQEIVVSQNGYAMRMSPDQHFPSLADLLLFLAEEMDILRIPRASRDHTVKAMRRFSAAKKQEGGYTWQQESALEQDALAVLQGKASGAFVVRSKPGAAGRSRILSYVFNNKIFNVDILYKEKFGALGGGYHLESSPLDCFDSIDSLVAYYTEGHAPLPCALRMPDDAMAGRRRTSGAGRSLSSRPPFDADAYFNQLSRNPPSWWLPHSTAQQFEDTGHAVGTVGVMQTAPGALLLACIDTVGAEHVPVRVTSTGFQLQDTSTVHTNLEDIVAQYKKMRPDLFGPVTKL
eukprot:m.195330 g.195330  ORF g.195330 m.195330 type:complete len:1688 (-) comp21813_c0_seq3:307-5370(-)